MDVQLDKYIFTVDEEGTVIQKDTLGIVTGQETKNTTVYDKLGNQVVVPAGFKVQNPDKTVVEGIVIEDISHETTKESEFVWIPIGNVKEGKNSVKNIDLKRYVFKEDGTIDEALTKTEAGDELKLNINSSYYYKEGVRDSTTINTHAKDIEAFKASAENNKGYYIGRYEARTAIKRTDLSNELSQLTEKSEDEVYNYVTQAQAADRSRNMYDDSNFTSDLVNSYAWDTAITFLQEFDNREESAKEIPYSRQNSLNTENLAEKGSDNDVICNVYDMASNTWEWTTEIFSDDKFPCIRRGGMYNNSKSYTSYRSNADVSVGHDGISFRPILYL